MVFSCPASSGTFPRTSQLSPGRPPSRPSPSGTTCRPDARSRRGRKGALQAGSRSAMIRRMNVRVLACVTGLAFALVTPASVSVSHATSTETLMRSQAIKPVPGAILAASARVEGHLWTLWTYRKADGGMCVWLQMGVGRASSSSCRSSHRLPKGALVTWGAAGHSAAAGRAGWNRVWMYGFLRNRVASVRLVRECSRESLSVIPARAFLRVLSPTELRTGGLPRQLILTDRDGKLVRDIHVSLRPPSRVAGRACARATR